MECTGSDSGMTFKEEQESLNKIENPKWKLKDSQHEKGKYTEVWEQETVYGGRLTITASYFGNGSILSVDFPTTLCAYELYSVEAGEKLLRNVSRDPKPFVDRWEPNSEALAALPEHIRWLMVADWTPKENSEKSFAKKEKLPERKTREQKPHEPRQRPYYDGDHHSSLPFADIF